LKSVIVDAAGFYSKICISDIELIADGGVDIGVGVGLWREGATKVTQLEQKGMGAVATGGSGAAEAMTAE